MSGDEALRAGCYLRISSDPRDKREGVERQREDTAVTCELYGWTVADLYTDNDRSATSGQRRPQWERLLADVDAGRIDAVVVWNQDRGWRNMRDLEELRPLFAARAVKLATTNIGLVDFNSPDDIFRAQVSTALSEMEVQKMKIRMRRAARQRAEKGAPAWRRAFGYTEGAHDDSCPPGCTRHHIVPDPVTAPWVRRVYAHIQAGGSISEAARMLNEAGALGQKWVRPRDAEGNVIADAEVVVERRPWTASTLSLFLRAPRNAGLRAHNGVILDGVKGLWEPLIDESTWRATQTLLNAPGRAPGPKTARKHLLTGVLGCGKPDCDGHLAGVWQKVRGGATDYRITYACKKCRGVTVRADHVEPLVFGLIAGRLAMPDAADLLRDNSFDPSEAQRLDDERQSLYAQVRAAEAEFDDGVITGRDLARRRERVAAKLAVIATAQHDATRVRVLDDLPLGRPEVAEALRHLSPDRYRAVIALVADFAVRPVGKAFRAADGSRFDPDRVAYTWK